MERKLLCYTTHQSFTQHIHLLHNTHDTIVFYTTHHSDFYTIYPCSTHQTILSSAQISLLHKISLFLLQHIILTSTQHIHLLHKYKNTAIFYKSSVFISSLHSVLLCPNCNHRSKIFLACF